ncbi:hypothetical protein GJ744_006206 [Endocarpon pusillum]|uniref:Uncharacterized protein n=1 Tax=Endocarpon pusillum TaxID=364733 RepID=A0A8H7E4V9_9EURO|nr:hypothetical protein GJ744_006206 [Endocarpon pusillum]
MSADLLAEFGQTGSSTGENGRKAYEPSSDSLQDKDVLIAIVPDAPEHAANPDKGDSLQGNIWRTDNSGADVLFDASIDHYDLDDDFGDFEDAKQETAQGQPMNLLDGTVSKECSSGLTVQPQSLLDLKGPNDSLKLSSSESQNRDQKFDWDAFSVVVEKERPKEVSLHASTEASSNEQAFTTDATAEVEEWEPFEYGEAEASVQNTHATQIPTQSGMAGTMSNLNSSPRRPPLGETTPTVPLKDERRPVNIPPPAILLQVLPRVFENLVDISRTHEPARCCKAILQTYTVTSHVIAGRSLRWKRDSILSQNNKIGPAPAGGKGGGMKLTAVDKSESLKEEQEVADVVEAWERYAHVFNSTLHKAGFRRPLMTLSERTRPRPVKGPGVLTSPYACALCGLKREERVVETDINVDDLFGEFWVEYWGHRDCKDFWQKNQALLPQR